MKNNTLKVVIAIVACTGFMTAGVNAANHSQGTHGTQEYHQSKDCHGGSHYQLRKMFRGLDLSDEQKTQVKVILNTYHDEMALNRLSKKDRSTQKLQMLSFITASTFNETEIKQALEAKQEERQQKVVNMMKLQNEVYQLLTPEQQQKFQHRFTKNKHYKR